jgi:quercetin dioxygenase-like cupin family protein
MGGFSLWTMGGYREPMNEYELNKSTGEVQVVEKDDLKEFLDWWLENKATFPPEENSTIYQGDTTGVVLYKKAPFQVELFIVKPGKEIKQHIHPNVDSYEVNLAGYIEFTCDGKVYCDGKPVRVKPNAWHGGFFPKGGSFISVQKWLNGVEPKFVGDDWVAHDGSVNYDESTKI